MSGLFRIIAVAVTGGILSLTLRRYNPVFGVITALASGTAVLLMLCDTLSTVVAELDAIVEAGGIDEGYIKVVMKVIGIAYITQFGADMLRDSGESSIASKCELAGKLFILYLTLPVIGDFLRMCVEIVDF